MQKLKKEEPNLFQGNSFFPMKKEGSNQKTQKWHKDNWNKGIQSQTLLKSIDFDADLKTLQRAEVFEAGRIALERLRSYNGFILDSQRSGYTILITKAAKEQDKLNNNRKAGRSFEKQLEILMMGRTQGNPLETEE